MLFLGSMGIRKIIGNVSYMGANILGKANKQTVI